jgi:hypothetical protein
MTINEKVDLLIQYVLEQDLKKIEKLENRLRVAIGEPLNPPSVFDTEDAIRNIFSELGITEFINGYEYAVCAIKMVAENPRLIDEITGKLYPAVGIEMEDNEKNTGRRIRHVVEHIFRRCDEETIQKYFGNTVNPETGKVTNGEFIARIAHIVRRWL